MPDPASGASARLHPAGGASASPTPFPAPLALTAKIYGRGIKRTADGIIYTEDNKIIAVHYAFYKPNGKKQRTVDQAETGLKVARKTLYQWRKQLPLAAGDVQTLPAGAVMTKTVAAIPARTDESNLEVFRTPAYTAPSTTSIRPDGLGPGAEVVDTTAAIHPGFVSPDLVEQLRKIDHAIGLTEAEKDHLAVRIDKDVGKAAEPFVSERVKIAVQTKLNSLDPGILGVLNQLRAGENIPSSPSSSEEALVTEQKLVTFLNCYVLRKNPWLGHEGIDTNIKATTNLWQCQKLVGKNQHPSPREGLLRCARLEFLWQHAIMGRAGDMRGAKLRHFYISDLPRSEPQKCVVVVQSIFEGKTNKDGRPERGVVARAKDVESCPVGALALAFFERFHVQGDRAPDLTSRREWYDDCLLVDPDIPASRTKGLTAEKQCGLLKHAFSDLKIVPTNLSSALFPWADAYWPTLVGRAAAHEDKTAGMFLDLVDHLRVVLLQDAAFLQPLYPTLALWSHAPFNSLEFASWAQLLRTKAESTPDPFTATIQIIAPTISSALASLRVDVAALGTEMRHGMEDTREALGKVVGKLEDLISSRGNRDVELAALESSCSAVLTRVQTMRIGIGTTRSSSSSSSSSSSGSPNPTSSSTRLLLGSESITATATVAAPSSGVITTGKQRILVWPPTVVALWELWVKGEDGQQPLKDLDAQRDPFCTKDNSARTLMKRIRKIVNAVVELSGGDHARAGKVAAVMDEMRNRGDNQKELGLRSLSDILTKLTTNSDWMTGTRTKLGLV
ncbi:unnamed protein product [Tilletia laevis]|nr:unnamed protein product [Tilletia laevis]